MRLHTLSAALATALLAAALNADATTRSAQARAAFKKQYPCPTTGRPRGACPGWVIDHVQPLACGGPDHPANMAWQTTADAKSKDRWELKVCEWRPRRPPRAGSS